MREGAATGTGLCYLKLKRENVTPNVTDYVSGSKYCRLPEWSKSTGTTYIRPNIKFRFSKKATKFETISHII